jgi:DNA repair exonuclease SbcCD nuclease subunit
MFKILHTADNHLRDTQYARRSRGEDFAKALLDVIHTAIRRRVTVVLIPGDLLDSTRPSPRIIEFLKTVDSLACKHGIQVLVTSGNHDLTDPHWAKIAGVESQRACGLRIIDNELVTLANGLTIYGQPFVNKEKWLTIKDTLPAADILMFHGMIAELTHFKSESAIDLAQLPTDRYQVIALGDIHHRKYVRVGACLVGYPGSTELCESSEDENKTVTELTFDDNGRLVNEDPVFLPVKTRHVLRFKLNTEDEVEEALLQAETQKASEPIVFVTYNTKLRTVPQRFATRLDPTKVLIRPYPMLQDPKSIGLGRDVRENLPLVAFLDKFIPPGGPLHALGTALLNPSANAVELVDRFIETRRQELETLGVV